LASREIQESVLDILWSGLNVHTFRTLRLCKLNGRKEYNTSTGVTMFFLGLCWRLQLPHQLGQRERIVAKALNPMDAWFAAEPCQLPLRIVPHVQFRLLYRSGQIPLAAQKLDDA